MKTIKDLNEYYNLELEKVILDIKENNAKLVLLQFPDGLKPYAIAVVDYLEENTTAEFVIWMESCYGACDTPVGVDEFDLVVQFGHSDKMPNY